MKVFKIFFFSLLGLFIVNGFVIGVQESQNIHFYVVFPLIMILIFFQGPAALSIANIATNQKSFFLILFYIVLELCYNALDQSGLQNIIKKALGILYHLLLPFIVYLVSYNFMSFEKGDILKLLYSIRRLVIVSMIVIIPGFIYSLNSVELNEFATNMAVFVFVFFIPFIMLKKTKWNFVIIALIIIAILFTAKRGAALGATIAYLITLIFDSKISVIKKFLFLLVPILFLGVLNLVFTEQIDKVYQRFEKESEISENEQYGSSRGDIWAVHFVKFADGSTSEKLFGFGAGSSGDLTERFSFRRVSAHNAYIGIGFEYGIVGLVLFVIFLIHLLFIIKKAYKTNFIFSDLMLYTLVLIIITSFTEVQFETYYIIYPFFFLGCMSGLLLNRNFNLKLMNKPLIRNKKVLQFIRSN